jgi:hypothetical protein
MDAWWYFEEGRSPQPIKRSISHVKPKHACMILYERFMKRGKGMKRKGGESFGRGGRPEKRHRTDGALPGSQSPPAGAPPIVWPIRALKRYPSWVDPLQFERIRQVRFENEAVRLAQEYYNGFVSAGGGEPLRLTFPVELEEAGLALGFAVIRGRRQHI